MNYSIEDMERDEGLALYEAAADRWQKKASASEAQERLYSLFCHGWEAVHGEDAYGLLSMEAVTPSLWWKEYGHKGRTFGELTLELPEDKQLKAAEAFARYDAAQINGRIIGDWIALGDLKWLLARETIDC